MLGLLCSLADWFNAAGFSVTSDSVVRLLEMIPDGLHFTRQQDVISLLQTCFAKTKEQYESVEGLLISFVQSKDMEKELARLKDEKKRLAANTAWRNDYEQELAFLREKEEQEVKAFVSGFVIPELVGKESLAVLESAKENTEWNRPGMEEKLLLDAASGLAQDIDRLMDAHTEVQAKLAQCMEDALWGMDMDRFDAYEKLLVCLDDIRERTCSARTCRDDGVAKIRKQYADQRRTQEEALQQAEKAHQKTEKELDRQMKKLLKENGGPEIVKKGGSRQHREKFIGGTRGVWSSDMGKTVFMDKKLTSLSREEASAIYRAIRRSSVHLKTRMMRSMHAGEQRQIDMAETIKSACRTGGLPMKLLRERQKPNKARLVLILDISGSCSGASKMMLNMMHSLQSAFPSGCKAFAFVNTLYDISRIMAIKDADTAVSRTLETIPTRGVYSDYSVPLKTMWEKYQSDITSDSTVIFIGDARNNRRESGERYLKNIVRKARKAYWLNTEEESMWGQGDSIAPLYARYTRMIPVLNARHLIQFVTTLK